jgi:hypothetical protein
MDIKYVNVSELVIPDWRCTYILRPDLMVISSSLSEYGFIQPIHIRRGTNEVIDGSERVKLTLNVKQINKKTGGVIPVIEHDIDSLSAIMMHLQLNRGRGMIMAKKMSDAIKKLYLSGKYEARHFDSMLCMKREEIQLMLNGSLLKTRNIPEHTYSRAWVPVEAPPGTIDGGQIIERPPNSDR